MSNTMPPLEYWRAKADLCRNLAIEQMINGDTKEGARNLLRMSHALNYVLYYQEKEKEKK